MIISAWLVCTAVAAQGAGMDEMTRAMASAEGVAAEEAAETEPEETPEPEMTEVEAAALADAAQAAALAGGDAIEKTGTDRLVAVLELQHAGDAGPIANALAQVITSDVGARDGLKAVSRNEIASILTHQAESSLLGCNELSCMADIAKLVAADLLITGTVDRVDNGALVVTLSLIDPNGPTVLERAESAWRGDAAEIVLVARPMIDRLFAGPDKSALVGSLEVFTEDGALIIVDGTEMGTAPLKSALTNIASGVHVVEVSKEGFAPGRRDVVVETGQTSIARLALEPEPYYTQWWFWTAVGGGATVAIAGGTAIAIAALSADTTVAVKIPLPAAAR